MSQVAKQCWGCALAARRDQDQRVCVICNTPYSCKRSLVHRACSPECSRKLRGRRIGDARLAKRATLVCGQCGRTRLVPQCRAGRKFCSRACAYKFRVGPNSSNWKGGITESVREFYRSREWARCRRAVRKRDQNTCRRCRRTRQKGEWAFDVHHVGSYLKFPDLRLDLDNLVLLCRDCHAFVKSAANIERVFIRPEPDAAW